MTSTTRLPWRASGRQAVVGPTGLVRPRWRLSRAVLVRQAGDVRRSGGHADRLVRHPSCERWPASRRLAGRLAAGPPTGWTSTSSPPTTFQVLDADASQRTVLAAIRQGGSLVVQGRPGTGKSQTIANAIAEAHRPGQDRPVRQRETGRAPGGGEAAALRPAWATSAWRRTGTAATRRPPSRRWRPRCRRPSNARAPATRRPSRCSAERRRALNAYAQALHDADNPLGASAFAIHGELAQRAARAAHHLRRYQHRRPDCERRLLSPIDSSAASSRWPRW